MVLFMRKQNVMILSDTEDQAKQFLYDIKVELTENQELINQFKIHRILKDDGKQLIVMMGDQGYVFRVFAKGSGQPLRGSKWRGKRPDLVVADDMENDELVANEDRREKLKKWMLGALLPLLSRDGHIRLVGTILHFDSFLESTLKSPHWSSKRYEAHDDNFENILWPERYTKEDLKSTYDYYTSEGREDVYYREFRNIPIDPTTAPIRAQDLLEIEPEDATLPGNYYIGADFATSTRKTADYTVFVVAKLVESGDLQVVEIVRDRMDSPTVIDEIFRLQVQYKPDIFAVEDENIAKTILPILNVEMMRRNVYVNIDKLVSAVDLMQRSWSIRARIRAHKVKFQKRAHWWGAVEGEMLQYPYSKHDDVISALSVLGRILDKMNEGPSKQDLEDEEFYEALNFDPDEMLMDEDEFGYYSDFDDTGY